MSPREIEVRINDLVLHGFSATDRLRIGAAMERELTRLVMEHGLPDGIADGSERDVVDAGSFVQAPRSTPATIGGQVAEVVYNGLG